MYLCDYYIHKVFSLRDFYAGFWNIGKFCHYHFNDKRSEWNRIGTLNKSNKEWQNVQLKGQNVTFKSD